MGEDKEVRCNRCGRILTNADSIKEGVGPGCMLKIESSWDKLEKQLTPEEIKRLEDEIDRANRHSDGC